MENTERSHVTGQSFDTISPSAKALLLLKGHTNIPFARQAAEIISRPEKYMPDFDKKDFGFWARVLHFEMRYQSINNLLTDLQVKNILELSSGFSFRSLQTALEKEVYYIDTDLLDLINTKKRLVDELKTNASTLKGELEIVPLNALDKEKFNEITNHFPPGELAIINEGLLMYLDMDEKKKLCSIIRQALQERGGYWITADIYVRLSQNFPQLQINDKLQQFFEQHKIEENKFDSFEAAKAFFEEQGFVVDKVAQIDHTKLSALKYFMESTSNEQLEKISKSGNMQETWRLKLAEKQ